MAQIITLDFQNISIFIFLCLFSLLCYALFFKKPKGFHLPPSPPSLPIIGHLHHLLSFLPHKSFQKLSFKYGPLLHLRVFNFPIVHVSSASMAYEIFRTHDVNVSYRFVPVNKDSLVFGSSGFVTAPFGDYWKFMKKLISTKLLRPHAIELSRGIRAEELRRFLERILVEHEEKLEGTQDRDMMDYLLEAYRNEEAEYKITRKQIKSLIVEIFLGGTDSSAQTIQWTMAEILNNPNVFEKLREEIDSVVGEKRLIQESDLPNLPYLQAVVKEGLRLHPSAPLLLRVFGESCEIKEFYIPEKTTLVVNLYAVNRDPDSWEDPDLFKPERFLASSGSGEEEKIREQALKYVTFGGGRRTCPAVKLAHIFMETAIGAMVQCFDWRIKGDQVYMEEAVSGLSLKMAHPLECTPVVRFDPFSF
ncbi:PREDICTED: cytochrome P450 705A20-like [Camelina sativa]|uniref:Cytochrome P450 705A20-like n=1 Tax=Camelina sativa TaxID=90675 RepID=A0ABM1R2R6_CAMSA|nr:PREDICTED: cytochrome P450 705A20-like [Camelina sativa]